ncbi:zinc finger and SCAN domain-containing protein 2 [Folsomia candida]|uniref:zinc finger and SCAN domain-containing protein 2 n=1 Tax=Folsomia candida TaxID=158441 RepID=UPI000B90804F|nr:zinc finger and SCAN domain-containing protein 2 [Folsomia candida]XP_021959456.1 zinc finger and SCAN domain-containing protein 2 [Folsomia candida]
METCTFCGGHEPCVVPSPKSGALSSYSSSCVTSLLTVFHIDGADPVAAHLATAALTCADCLQLTRDIDLELRSLLKFLKNLDLLRSRLARRVKRAAAATTSSKFSATRDLNEKIQQEIPLVNKAFEAFNFLRIQKGGNNNELNDTIKNPGDICKQEIRVFHEIKDEPVSDHEAEANVENNIILEVDDGDDDMDQFAIDPVDDHSDANSSDYSPSSPDSEDSSQDYLPNPRHSVEKFDNDVDMGDSTSSTSNPLQCPVCFKTFGAVSAKRRHIRQHHDSTFTPFECPVDNCDRVFRQAWHFRDHILKYHPGVDVPQFKRRWTPKTENGEESGIVPKKERISCPVEDCEKSYTRNQRVIEHLKIAHPDFPLQNYKPSKKRNSGNARQKSSDGESLPDYSPSSPNSDDSSEDDSPPNPTKFDNDDDIGNATSSSSNPLQCPVCSKTFGALSAKRRHIRQHHDSTFTPFECPVDNCDRVFRQFWHFRDHIVNFHPGVDVPQVEHRRTRKTEEIRADGEDRIPCPVEDCEKSYSRNQRVVEHLKILHPDFPLQNYKPRKKRNIENARQKNSDGQKEEILCPVEDCEKSYSRNQRVVEHMKTAHPDVPIPETFGRRVKTEGDEDPPKNLEGDLVPQERIPCPVETCDKSYSRNQRVVEHVRIAHPDVPLPTKRRRRLKLEGEKVKEKRIRVRTMKRKPCPVCGKEYRSSGLSEHLKTHTAERNHLCTKCGKLFRTARNLRLHDADVHIKERNFICALCGASFVRKSVLDNHVATIHDQPEDLRFSCDTCGKAYRQERNLREHMQMHTSQSWRCPICDKAFNRRVNVRLHVRAVHEGVKNIGKTGGRKKDKEEEDMEEEEEEEESAYHQGEAYQSVRQDYKLFYT